MIGFCAQDYQTLRNHMRIPFVVYDGICGQTERIVNLSIDNSGGGEQVGRHFRALGHTRAFACPTMRRASTATGSRAFSAALRRDTRSCCGSRCKKDARWAYYGQQLERLRGVTAAFAVSDHYAIDLMSFLRGQGIAVPEEISVAGFDDTPVCEMVSPALTTVRQDGAARARIAMEKLQALREGRTVGEEVILPVTLVVRGSTRIRK